jgi:hypothetical protein
MNIRPPAVAMESPFTLRFEFVGGAAGHAIYKWPKRTLGTRNIASGSAATRAIESGTIGTVLGSWLRIWRGLAFRPWRRLSMR